MVELRNLVIAAGGAAGLAAVLYFLFKDGDGQGELLAASLAHAEEQGKKKLKPSDLDRDVLLSIFGEMEAVQKQVKVAMAAIVREINEQKLTFEQAYTRIKGVMPADPLESFGLSMGDLEMPLQKCHMNGDAEVLNAFQRAVMGGGSDPSQPKSLSDASKALTVDKIAEINAFMLEELQKVIAHYKSLPNQSHYDKQIVGAVCRVLLDARVEERYAIGQEDMEAAIHKHADKLKENPGFWSTYAQMEQAMGSI